MSRKYSIFRLSVGWKIYTKRVKIDAEIIPNFERGFLSIFHGFWERLGPHFRSFSTPKPRSRNVLKMMLFLYRILNDFGVNLGYQNCSKIINLRPKVRGTFGPRRLLEPFWHSLACKMLKSRSKLLLNAKK